MSKYVLFDVGANWGHDSLPRTKNDPNVECWAFEPTPELIQHLEKESKDFSSRYHINTFAVCDYNGEATFNIADNPGCDWGTSSLNTFSDHLQQTWPGRTDFKVNRTLQVQVRRLDTWFKETKPDIERIDYFHCDTQGSDLKVLIGMGEYVRLIEEGVVECARDNQVKLYKENHTVDEMTKFLEAHGFYITRHQSNDVHNNEINIYFKKK